MRYASKVDRNQVEIVTELRKLGFDVDIVSREKRLYDLIVSGVPTWAYKPVAVRVEIKASEKEPMTPDEIIYWQNQRHGENLIRAHCTEDVLVWFGK